MKSAILPYKISISTNIIYSLQETAPATLIHLPFYHSTYTPHFPSPSYKKSFPIYNLLAYKKETIPTTRNHPLLNYPFLEGILPPSSSHSKLGYLVSY